MGIFRQCLTEISARDTIMVEYYNLTFLFGISVFFLICDLKCQTLSWKNKKNVVNLSPAESAESGTG